MLKITVSIIPHGIGPERQLGELRIANVGGGRIADYRCTLSGEGLPQPLVSEVRHYPRWAEPIWDLVARAICKTLAERERLPRRPAPLQVPVLSDPSSGISYVRVSDMPEPARSEFLQWATGSSGPVIEGETIGGCFYVSPWRGCSRGRHKRCFEWNARRRATADPYDRGVPTLPPRLHPQ